MSYFHIYFAGKEKLRADKTRVISTYTSQKRRTDKRNVCRCKQWPFKSWHLQEL